MAELVTSFLPSFLLQLKPVSIPLLSWEFDSVAYIALLKRMNDSELIYKWCHKPLYHYYCTVYYNKCDFTWAFLFRYFVFWISSTFPPFLIQILPSFRPLLVEIVSHFSSIMFQILPSFGSDLVKIWTGSTPVLFQVYSSFTSGLIQFYFSFSPVLAQI